jgi:hypothetical protein
MAGWPSRDRNAFRQNPVRTQMPTLRRTSEQTCSHSIVHVPNEKAAQKTTSLGEFVGDFEPTRSLKTDTSTVYKDSGEALRCQCGYSGTCAPDAPSLCGPA